MTLGWVSDSRSKSTWNQNKLFKYENIYKRTREQTPTHARTHQLKGWWQENITWKHLQTSLSAKLKHSGKILFTAASRPSNLPLRKMTDMQQFSNTSWHFSKISCQTRMTLILFFMSIKHSLTCKPLFPHSLDQEYPWERKKSFPLILNYLSKTTINNYSLKSR